MKRFPQLPVHPERLCWGCDRYCASDNMLCGNGSERSPHPVELFGAGWSNPLLPAEPAQPTQPASGEPDLLADKPAPPSLPPSPLPSLVSPGGSP